LAAGDVVIVWVLKGQIVTYQPAAGVEVSFRGVINMAGSGYNLYGLFNGTNFIYMSAGSGFVSIWFAVNSTYYLKVDAYSAGANANNIVVMGIQTKGSAMKIGDKVLTGDELKAYREKWLAKRKQELKVGEITTTVTLPDGSTKTLVLKEIKEDRDDLGDLRGIICVYGE
jgi:hypothetical protein